MGLTCRCYSKRLQRAIVDFGADCSFQKSQQKIKEHYGIEIPVSGIQSVTENHAKKAYEYVDKQSFKDGKADLLIDVMDGSMLPIVETGIPQEGWDSRKCRKTRWQEARLCMTKHHKEVTPLSGNG